MKWFVLLMVALAAPVSAGSSETPEVTDDTGDVDVRTLAPIGGVSDPTATSGMVDIVASWLSNETAGSIELHMRVVDLSGLEDLRQDPQAFIRVGTRWETDYVPGAEDYWGRTWVASVYATGAAAWTATVQPPDQDDVAVDGVIVDLAADTFTITIPKSTLGNPVAGDRLLNLTSLHDMHFPAYGFFFVDQAPEGESTASYTFTAGLAAPTPSPEGAPPASPGNPGPSTSPSGPTPTPNPPALPPTAPPAQPGTPPSQPGSPAESGKESPLPATILLAALVVGLLGRRRSAA